MTQSFVSFIREITSKSHFVRENTNYAWLHKAAFPKKTGTRHATVLSMRDNFPLKLFQFSPIVADPCDPTTLSKTTPSVPRVQHSGENRTPGKSKASKTKGKGKKTHEDDRPSAPVRKLWYEALSPEGYTYYWHIETNGTYPLLNLFFIFSLVKFSDTRLRWAVSSYLFDFLSAILATNL